MTYMVSCHKQHRCSELSQGALDELPWATVLIDAAGDIWDANRAAQRLLGQLSSQFVQSHIQSYLTSDAASILRDALGDVHREQRSTIRLTLAIKDRQAEMRCVLQPLDTEHAPPLFALALLAAAEPAALSAALLAAVARCFEASDPSQLLATLQEAVASFGIWLELALRDPRTAEWHWTGISPSDRSARGLPAELLHFADARITAAAPVLGNGSASGAPHTVPFLRQLDLSLPLVASGQQWGVLVVSGPGLNEATQTLFPPLGQLLGVAVERVQQRAGLHLDQHQTSLLLKAGQALTAVTELDDVLRVICEQALKLSGGITAALFTPEEDSEYLRCIMALGPDSELLLGQRSRATDTLAGRVLREGRVRAVDDIQSDLDHGLLVTPVTQLRSVMLLALRAQGRAVGVLAVWHPGPRFFGPLQQQILEQYSSTTAVAIENAQLHEAMRRSEERYRTLFQNALEIVITLDLEGQIIAWNRAALRFLGLSPAELRGGVLNIRELLSPEQTAVMLDLQTRALQGYAIVPTAIEMLRSDGSRAIVEITVQLFQERGQPRGVYIIGRDITDRRQLEAQLRQGEKLAALGQLAAGAAHELNNPLAVVLGTTQLLLHDPHAAAFSEDIRNIEAAAQRAKHVIKQMLTFAREHEDVRGPVELSVLVGRALQGMRKQLNEGGVQVSLDLAPELPPVWGDGFQLEQVFDNLLHNAAQALGESAQRPRQIKITGTTVGKLVRVSIADNGPGIAPQVLPRIFDPFFTTKEVGSGTGLGLSLVYGIIDKHGGTIRAESVHGQGATFVVDLPVSTQSAATIAPVTTRGPRSSTILVVEDELDVRMILERALTQYGYAVDTVESAEAALIRIADKQYDLVITDMRMRGMSGRELFERARAHQPSWVFVTGDTMSVSSETFLKQTGVPVLPKPFTLEELWEVVALGIVGKREPSKAA